MNRRHFLGNALALLASLGLSGRREAGAAALAAAARPPIIGRAQWGADERYRFDGGAEIWPVRYQHYTKALIHHTATSDGDTDPAALVRAIYYYHAVSLGWGDIGYNYLIDHGGRIYEGRAGGEGVIGGHALRYNPGSVGIAVIGTFTEAGPNDAAINALVALLTYLCNRWGIDPRGAGFFVDKTIPNIAGHRDALETACPGNGLYSRLGGIRQATYDRIPEYGQAFVAHNTPTRLGVGQRVGVTLQVRNGGKRTWTPAEFKVGFRWRDARGNVVGPAPHWDLRTAVPRDVPLGGQVEIQTQLIAPSQEGPHTLEWDIVHSNVTWISWTGAPGLALSVGVGQALVDRATFLSANTPPRLLPGQTVTVTHTIRNSGTTQWVNTGRFAYRLGYRWYDATGNQVVQPPADDLRTPLPVPVNPGEVVTLAAQLKAPATTGELTLRWDMVHEGFHWFADVGGTPLSVAVRVGADPYAAQFVSVDQPPFMQPAQTRTVRVILRNTGTNTWTTTGRNAYRLGYRWYTLAGQQVVQPAEDDLRTNLPREVAQGGEVIVIAQIKAPSQTGTYTVRWDMVHEGVTWFADRGSPPAGRQVVVTSNPIVERRFGFVARGHGGGW